PSLVVVQDIGALGLRTLLLRALSPAGLVVVQDIRALGLRTLAPTSLVVIKNVRALSLGALLFGALSPASLVVVEDIRALSLGALVGALRLNGGSNGSAEEREDDGKNSLHLEICCQSGQIF